MSSLVTWERASAWTCLDSARLVDGVPLDALTLRSLAAVINRLQTKGEVLACLCWDVRNDAGDDLTGAVMGYGWPDWIPVTAPLLVPKKPGLTKLALRAELKIEDETKCWLQVVTRRAPFQLRNSAITNIVECQGDTTTDFLAFALDDIPIDDGAFEVLQVWLKGQPSDTLGDEGTYGANNTGTIDLADDTWVASSDGLAWNVTGNMWGNTGHLLRVKDSGGRVIMRDRIITGVDTFYAGASRTGGKLIITPNFQAHEKISLVDATYEIIKANTSRWRLGSLTLRAQDMEP